MTSGRDISRDAGGGSPGGVPRGNTGVILAGGKSARMGSDKAMLELGGMTFLELLRGTLRAVTGEVVVSASDPAMYPDAGVRVIGDVFRNCGPLGGIHAALTAIATPRAFIVSCDTPLATPAACRRMLSRDLTCDVLIAAWGGRLQPLFGLWDKKILPELEETLRQGRYSVLDFLGRVKTAAVDPGPSAGLVNVNTPGDYAELVSRARAGYSTTAPSPLI